MYFKSWGLIVGKLCVTWFDMWKQKWGLEVGWNGKTFMSRGF